MPLQSQRCQNRWAKIPQWCARWKESSPWGRPFLHYPPCLKTKINTTVERKRHLLNEICIIAKGASSGLVRLTLATSEAPSTRHTYTGKICSSKRIIQQSPIILDLTLRRFRKTSTWLSWDDHLGFKMLPPQRQRFQIPHVLKRVSKSSVLWTIGSVRELMLCF